MNSLAQELNYRVVSYSEAEMPAAYQQFTERYPHYGRTQPLDQLRATDYQRLDDTGQVYLDYTGGGLHGISQLEAHFALLRTSVLGNPHSANPTSMAMTDLVEETRQDVLNYFNASPDAYMAIFTANASGALKHVGESYPFGPGSRYLLAFDNHNSVNGIREFAKSRGATVDHAPLKMPDLRIDGERLEQLLARADPDQPNLFAYPAQSNFSGVKHPLEYVELAHSFGWDVLLDAAAFVPSNRLDLSQVQPDFVCMSFYKMFGYPTGIGCLLLHRRVFNKMQRPWFAGGTVNLASVRGEGHILAKTEAAFEDGTIDYLNIPAIKIGLQHIESISIESISERIRCLTGWLLEELYALRHSNGRPLVRIYGPTTTENRGGTIALNFYDPDEKLFDYRRVEEMANERGISLRTGCFCNPGASESAEDLTAEEMRAGLSQSADMNLPRFVQFIKHRGGKSAGAVRVSLGLASNFADAYRFMNFAADFVDQTNLTIGEVKFDIEACRMIRDGS